ncbi:MAG: hypothetical protein ACK5HY_13705, partial [Parahaliea sp.]
MAQDFTLALDSELGRRLSNTPENGWVQLNINRYEEVWTPLDQRPRPSDAPSVGSPRSIIGAWSSMSWDNNRGQLIFFGGGHANYPGNEIYRWDASSLRWHRASLPSEVYRSPNTSAAVYYAVDGLYNAPAAAHTYDSSEFLPIADRFITFGGAAFNTGRYFEKEDGTRTGPYMWDPSRAGANAVGGTEGSQVNPHIYTSVTGGEMWDNRDNLQPPPGEGRPGFGGTYWINGTSAYYEEDGKDVLFLQVSSHLWKYTVNDVNSAATDTYERLTTAPSTPSSGQGAGGYAPDRSNYLRSAGRSYSYWLLDPSGAPVANQRFQPDVEG